MWSAHVKFDEYTKVHKVETMKEHKDYKNFIHFYEDMNDDEAMNQVINQQQQVSMTFRSHTMNVELHLEIELHSNIKINVHERNAKLPNREVQSDSKAKRSILESRAEPRLSKYVRQHHLVEQIIGDKEAKPRKKNKLRSDTCFLRIMNLNQ